MVYEKRDRLALLRRQPLLFAFLHKLVVELDK
jgi:hypothetical protein